MMGLALRFLTRLQSLLWIWLFGLSAIVIWGIGTLVKGINYDLLIIVTMGGLMLGGLLARLRMPWWLALSLFVGTGAEVVLVLVGRLLPLLLVLLKIIAIYITALWWWGPNPLPDPGPLWGAIQDIGQGGGVVLARLWTWSIALNDTGARDPLAVQMVWGWTLWLAAGLAAYLVWQGRQALVAVAPLGALLTITTFFTEVGFDLLSIFLLLALALQVGSGWRNRHRRWQNTGLDWATDLALDLTFAAVPLICLIVALSLITPQISLARLAARFQHSLAESGRQVDSMAASLGMERQVIPPARPIVPGGLPRRHLLGSGPELSQQVVMTIKTDEPPPSPPEEPGGRPPPAHYWLGATFDAYTGFGWASSRTSITELSANEPQLQPQGPGQIVTQTVYLAQPYSKLLLTVGFPLQVDRPAQVAFRSNQDWAGTVLETETYTAQSWLSRPTPDELRAAGTDIPDWIEKRYLALPESLPTRVRDLALELTATAPTPYDRALALEAYLRQIPYSLDLPEPPLNRDVADYFLFDLRVGYCDYYATSMAVLARAAGLPARFVIGYAPGPYDYQTGRYVVRESEAHSWTQIYFPGYGWVDFEPTGGRAPLNRSEEEEQISPLPTLPPDYERKQSGPGDTGPAKWVNWGAVLLGGLAALVAGGRLALWGDDRRLAHLPVERLVPLLASRLEYSARLLEAPVSAGSTPLEFQAALLHYLTQLIQKQPLLQKFAPPPADITKLVSVFIHLRYAPRPPTNLDGVACLTAWRRLRWRLWGLIVAKRLMAINSFLTLLGLCK